MMVREAKASINGRVKRSGKVDVTRMRGEYTALGYRAVTIANREGRAYSSQSADQIAMYDRPKLIAQSRAFYRDNAIYKGLIDRAVTYIVGNGFKLQCTTNTKSDKKVESLWKTWFRRPEVRNLLNGGRVSRLLCKDLIMAGDVAALKTDERRLQFFEAEQIDSPMSTRFRADGIIRNDFGRVVGFRLCPYNDNGYVDTMNGSNKPVNQVVYVSNPERFSQTRGVPALQSAFSMLHRVNDVCDSEAIAWQMLARLAIAVTRENGPELGYTESTEDTTKSNSDLTGDLAQRMVELDNALIFNASPGEKVEGIERNIPGDKFSDSLRTFLRLIGLPMGLPLELVLLDWTNSNYSQSRAVLEQAYYNFSQWQEDLVDFFYTPVLEWLLPYWRTQDSSIKKEMTWDWIKPTFPWIDQLKEVQASGEMVDRGFTTHADVCKSRNRDRDDMMDIREKEVMDAIERAARINEQYPDAKVDWRIFAGLDATGNKSSVTLADNQQNMQETQNANGNNDQTA